MNERELLTIKEWSIEDRPREKLLNKGLFSMSNAELLAILIGSGTRKGSALDLARSVLQHADDNLNDLARLTVPELCSSIKGVGPAKATSIVAALELGRRRSKANVDVVSIRSSSQVAALFSPILEDLPFEEFWILLLNRANKVIAKYKIASGGVHQCLVDNRIIFRYAVQHLASSIVLCHNHPSGTLSPSDADKQLTEKIIKAAKHFDINIIDHIIVVGDLYYSFADERLI